MALGCIFFVSGAVSLVYEVVWARQLSLTLGNSADAHTLVVALFMGGLGLGYGVFGRLADRVQSPLRWYAALELAISTWALLSLWLLGRLSGSGRLYDTVAPALILLIPTVLMGGTLPMLTRGLVNRGLGVGASVASLYAVNSAGAVIGTLGSGLILLEAVGVHTTLYLAAGVNLLLVPAALALTRSTPPPPKRSPATALGHHAVPLPSPSGHVRLPVYVGFAFILGCVALGLQGVWLRYFGMVFGSSSYAFTLVIGVFIAAIALGSAAARRWVSRWRGSPNKAFLILLGALIASLLAVEPIYERLPFLLVALKHYARETAGLGDAGFALYTALRLALVGVVIVVPIALSGALLPILTAAATPHSASASTVAGRVFAGNTAGSVLGVVITVPHLIGWIGLGETYRALTIALLLAGLIGVFALHSRLTFHSALIGGLALSAAAIVVPSGWDTRLLSAGGFRMRTAPTSFEKFSESARRGEVIFHEDGPNATVLVVEHRGRQNHRTLIVNGKPDASTRGDMLTQVGSGHLPLLLHPNPKEVLIVGLGSGVTVGSAALHPVRIDAVELSPAVVRSSTAFEAVNNRPLARPSVSLHVDDARSFIQRRPPDAPLYDVVISEPSNPWIAGNAGLFGLDFFRLVRSHLAPDGVYAQWLHLYETDDTNVEMVIRTLGKVFEDLSLWELFPNDVLLIARTGQVPSFGASDSWAQRLTAEVLADLRRVHLDSAAALKSLRAISSSPLRQLATTPGPITTDAHPLLEFRAPRALFAGHRATLLQRLDERQIAPRGLTVDDAQRLFVLHTVYPGAPEAYRLSLIPQLVAHSEASFLTDVLFTLTGEGHFREAQPVHQRLSVIAPESTLALYAGASLQARQGQVDAAIATLRRCLRLGDEPKARCSRLFAELTTVGR